jgi:hypothetical protein
MFNELATRRYLLNFKTNNILITLPGLCYRSKPENRIKPNLTPNDTEMKKRLMISQMALISILILVPFASCRQIKTMSTKQEKLKDTIENFDLFYERFHKDSLFQISRLKFPLKGGPDRGDGQEEWTKENWDMLKIKIYDVDTSQYKVFYEKLQKSFTEKVWIEDSGFSIENRYELINNKWFLVSAFEMNN